MGRASRSIFLTVLFLSLLGFQSISSAEPTPNTELEGILRKIEARHYRWIAIRAEVLFFFAGSGNSTAMCGGELLYQRLDERMFLSCVDTQKELAFAFRTLDRHFDLYLPSQNTVYHGSIFDLEDSPDIESHLKARDLYRALKPLTVDPRRTKVERTNSLVTNLDVYSQNGAEGALVRRLYLTPEGDVRGEIYYGANGRSVTEIQRYDFKEFRGHVGIYDSIIFPKKITIVSPETQKGSAIFFSKVTALDTIDPLEFILRTPPGTKEIFLDEKNTHPPASTVAGAAPIPNSISHKGHKDRTEICDTSNERRSVPAAVLPTKAVPVYLATPLKKPAVKKVAPVRAREEKKATPQAPAPKSAPVVAPASPAPKTPDVSESMTTNTPTGSPASPDQPSTTNSQTTLDPSVEPSADMGKP